VYLEHVVALPTYSPYEVESTEKATQETEAKIAAKMGKSVAVVGYPVGELVTWVEPKEARP